MNNLPGSNDIRQKAIAYEQERRAARTVSIPHDVRIKRDLKRLGMTAYGLHKMESHYLPKIIRQDEILGGVVYGLMDSSSVMLVATDKRIIFLDVKPFFITKDEITYDVVSGVSYTHAGIWSTLTLHTRIKDYPIRTVNDKSCQIFYDYVDYRCLSKEKQQNKYTL